MLPRYVNGLAANLLLILYLVGFRRPFFYYNVFIFVLRVLLLFLSDVFFITGRICKLTPVLLV